MVSVDVGFHKFSAFATMCGKLTGLRDPPAMTTCMSQLPTDGNQDLRFVGDCAPSSMPSDNPGSVSCVKHSILFNYKVGDTLRLIKNGMDHLVDVLAIEMNADSNTEIYHVALPDGQEKTVTQEFLMDPTDNDVGLIPVSLDQVKTHLHQLSSDEIEALAQPVEPDQLLQEFMAWHQRSSHLLFQDMFRLAENGLAPPKFLKLKGRKLICPSCLFGKAKRRK